MHIGIDIDGTIGYRNMQRWAELCNEHLELSISSERLRGIGYDAFIALPELAAHKEHVGDIQHRRDLDWMALHPDALLAMQPMRDAAAGVTTLAALGTVAYYTARYSTILPERNEPMAQATLQWLYSMAFPNPTQVIFCESAADKLCRLAHLIKTQPQEVMLIDDRYGPLLEALAHLEQDEQALLCRHMTLVAFGTDTIPCTDQQLRVVALPCWRQVDSILVHCTSSHGS